MGNLRPPIGIIPKWLWLEKLEVPNEPSKEELANRNQAVQEAKDRYSQAGLTPDPFCKWE